jgi:hypothetical protein
MRVLSFSGHPWTNRRTREPEKEDPVSNPDDGDPDVITDLADRARAMSEFEFEIEWWSLTTDEQVKLQALLDQRLAHAKETPEAIEETNRSLKALFVLLIRKAPAAMTVGQALQARSADSR